jgi:superfamily I DNA/RNA helicase/mRNA-degrading endonuclease RelE of RelBE toxin-antitoxin system
MTEVATWEICQAEDFPLDLGRLPKAVRNAYSKWVMPLLRMQPDRAEPPKVRKLVGYKDLWRLRVSDNYRLVYRVDHAKCTVILLMVGDRNKIYERLGAKSDGTPGIRILANARELLEREPTAREQGAAEIVLADQTAETPPPHPDKPLPYVLESTTMTEWGVPVEYHELLRSCRTEGDLLAVEGRVPGKIIERVLSGFWPPTIEVITQEPVRVTESASAVEAAADGQRSLESFLLQLDEEQKAFLERFERTDASGPWLLKGGPGSGKSTVALYCIRSLLNAHRDRQPSIKILFTTFTNALVIASNYLLHFLTGGKGASAESPELAALPEQIKALIHQLQSKHSKVESIGVEIHTVDKLAKDTLPNCHPWLNAIVKTKDPTKIVVTEMRTANELSSFDEKDVPFLANEIDWTIIGQGFTSEDDYLKADRTGRGRPLNENQRRQVWRLYSRLCHHLRQRNRCLIGQRLQEAARLVKPRYDYVFIDEAQDLKPVAIRLCLRLCRDPKNVFLTADTNQSIYGNGLSWSRVADELRFQGRARILKRNYRTTIEVWQAIRQVAPTKRDQETLDEVLPAYSGPVPIYVRCTDSRQCLRRLNQFLHESLILERVPASCAAVLCPTNKLCDEIARQIAPQLKPKAMPSNEVDMEYAGVKVMTMHAAKGLQFPVVALVGVERDQLPWPAQRSMDEEEHLETQHRLFFVACSRAMRRLAVFGSARYPSRFVTGINDQSWEIEDL